MADTPELSEAKRALLEKYLRGDIRVSTTQAAPMVAHAPEIADLRASPDARVSLLPIQPRGSKRPFYYLHPHWYGGAAYCFTIAQILGMDQPLYVLDPYRYDGMRVPPSFETVASAYVEAIRSVQPEGPYLLGGFCGGGLLAFEIARQLRAQDQTVDLLVLIEAEDGPTLHRMLTRRVLGGAFRKIGRVLGVSTERQLDWFAGVRHVYLMVRYPGLRPGKTFWQSIWPFPSVEALRQDPIGLFVWAVSQYRPTRYPGKLTYFWARDRAARRMGGWQRVREADDIETYVIAGTHSSCRNEDVGDLARQLKVCLTAVQDATPSSVL
jgi:Thioesterase domain